MIALLFDTHKDLYIAFTYIPPEGSVIHSPYNKEIFDILEESVAKYISRGNVLIIGDLNSKYGITADSIESDIIDKTLQNHTLSILSYIPDEETTKCRTEENNTVNSHGLALISLCRSMQLRILNGRSSNDKTARKSDLL